MHTRVVTVTEASHLDDEITFLREKAVPVLDQQKGYHGALAGADWSTGSLFVMTFWETAVDCEASEGAAGKLRHEAQEMFGGPMTVEHFDQVVFDIKEPPEVGSCMATMRFSMNPAHNDANLAHFMGDVLPAVQARTGYQALCRLLDPETGRGFACSAWRDETSLQEAALELRYLRDEAMTRGVSFGDAIHGEIVFTDLH